MSLRRSSRLFKSTSTVTAIDHVNEAPLVITEKKQKQPKRSRSPSKTIVTKKSKPSPIKKAKIQDQFDEPAHWKTVYERIREYRKTAPAPVDTMGCERLAEEQVPEKVQRFQTLVSLMLSSQTKDTVTSAAVKTLQTSLSGGLTLNSILQVDEKVLDNYIKSVGFHNRKAKYIKDAAIILRDKYDGDIPDTIEGLTSLPGVGPKMGYLALQCAWKINAGIGVDVHVHRIGNRLGWCDTVNGQPEDTRKQLQSWLPKEYWRPINPLLVGFGQVMCLPRGPKCGECPVSDLCPSAVTKVKKMKNMKEEEKVVMDQGNNIQVKMEQVEEEQDIKTIAFAGGHEPKLIKTEKNPLDW
ncbi:DNA glycosylase [Phascolomyces articulosus]|uniref:Endonuclease III homolog n=1 Tax=Phascolomyces articulosus TaxID=60185 RepID=A0AAD5PJT3_9FUNG|nr:DNA glycosylase [Phascolomyces articulosus]